MSARVLVIDNYDSFVYNLVQYLGELGATPIVHRNDAITVDQVEELAPDAILVSPGPGRPEDAGISNDVIARLGGSIPILGVCLGHQCIGQVFGADIVRAGEVMHGKTSFVHHGDRVRFHVDRAFDRPHPRRSPVHHCGISVGGSGAASARNIPRCAARRRCTPRPVAKSRLN